MTATRVKTTTQFSLDSALGTLSLVIEPMQPAHIPAVVAIDREAFSLPWPERAYRHEVTQNEFAHYYVLCPQSVTHSPPPMSAWQRLWQGMRPRPTTGTSIILGYGGFWLMYDEAHISTLAVRAEYRRQGLGELMLVVLLEEARRLRALRVTLEVRVSNAAAQALYAKYSFEQVGRRKAYYNDNREDALILTTPELASLAYKDLVENRRRDLLRRLDRTSLDKILQMH
jgi:ribosomal-protein-alanine N-acetyltransferase